MYENHTLSIREPYVSDADLLTLVQWLSPAFPVGGFAYSHGLEWVISEGQVVMPRPSRSGSPTSSPTAPAAPTRCS